MYVSPFLGEFCKAFKGKEAQGFFIIISKKKIREDKSMTAK